MLLRLAALAWLPGLHERGSLSTREAMRQVGWSFYAETRQFVFLPLRMLAHFSRWTYKLGTRPPR